MRATDVGGFTLPELLVVLSIVLILAGIALPNLLQARASAYEASASVALRTITIGQNTYFAVYQGYAPSLQALGPPVLGAPPSAAAADLIDLQLASGMKGAYRFNYFPVDPNGDGVFDGYLVVAEPVRGGARRVFVVDQTGVIGRDGGWNAQDRPRSGSVGGERP